MSLKDSQKEPHHVPDATTNLYLKRKKKKEDNNNNNNKRCFCSKFLWNNDDVAPKDVRF